MDNFEDEITLNSIMLENLFFLLEKLANFTNSL